MSRFVRRWLPRGLVRLLCLALVGAGVWLALPATPTAAAASTFFVSPTGDDAGPGTRQRPWSTIQHAVDTAPAGASIKVRAGTYAPFTVSRERQSIAAVPGEVVVVPGAAGVRDVVLVDRARRPAAGADRDRLRARTRTRPAGSRRTAAAASAIDATADDVKVSGTTVRDSHGVNSYGLPFGCYGILVHGADGSLLSGNDISGNGSGIYFNGGARGARVRRQQHPRQRRDHPQHPRRQRRLRRQRGVLHQPERRARAAGVAQRADQQRRAVLGLRGRRRGLRGLQRLEPHDHRQHAGQQRERPRDRHRPGRPLRRTTTSARTPRPGACPGAC